MTSLETAGKLGDGGTTNGYTLTPKTDLRDITHRVLDCPYSAIHNELEISWW